MKKALKVVCGVVGATVLAAGAAVAALELADLYHECKRKERDTSSKEDDFDDDFDDFDEDLDGPDAPPVAQNEPADEAPKQDETPSEDKEIDNTKAPETEELTQEQKIEKAFEPVNS